MGCHVAKNVPSKNEETFMKKANLLVDAFSELKTDVCKYRNLLCQKFHMKNRLKSNSTETKYS